MYTKKSNILVIGNLHIHPSAKAFLDKFVWIIKEVSNRTYVISGNNPSDYDNVSWVELRINQESGLIRKILAFLKIQMKLLQIIARNRMYYDVAIILPTPFVLPTVFLRLAKKRVALFVAQKPDNSMMRFLCRLNFAFSDLLIVESSNVMRDWKIDRYSRKVMKGSIYVDTSLFKNEKEIREREQIVGYIGSLEERKGIRELIKAISIINTTSKYEIKFLIGGTGKLESLVKNFSLRNNNVKFIGFIPKEDLPKLYNKVKLLVLPSYSEGLPNVILEAMVCSTPVLATPVGGIPDVIKDGETGFIMENNSPECIAKNVIRALGHPELERISKNGLALVKQEFTYEAAVERWRKILGK